jgi:acetyl esterase/lipase
MQDFKPPFPGGPPPGAPPLGKIPPGAGFVPTGGPQFDEPPPKADVSGIRRKFLDVKYGVDSETQKIDIYLPENKSAKPYPLLLHIHGGAFAIGDKRDGHITKLLDALEHGYAFASVDYRLSGEAIFPAAVLDCRAAIRYLKANAAKYELDPSRFAVIGGSAGGNLVALMAMNIPNGEFYGEQGQTFSTDASVKTAVEWFGPTDFKQMDAQAEANGISFKDHNAEYSPESCYIGTPIPVADNGLVQKANPMTYISKDMAPLLIEHGTVDKLVPFQQSLIFIDALDAAGLSGRFKFIPLENAEHDDPQFESDENMAIVWDWLNTYL